MMYDNFPHAKVCANFPNSAHDLLDLDGLLTTDERNLRGRIRNFMVESEVAPIITEYWERAEFPFSVVPLLSKLGVGNIMTLSASSDSKNSAMLAAIVVSEIARVDGSLSTFVLVHGSLCAYTLLKLAGMLGSEQQKHKLLPSLESFNKIGAWALTEPSNGSDASALTTVAEKVEKGWLLNGSKRWIGNGTFADIVIVWARNAITNKVNAFVVFKDTPGFTTTKIENKIALRCVQNANIFLKNCFVPDENRLPGVDNFQDTNKVLSVSRVLVAWQPVGLCLGVFDVVMRYVKERKQFKKPIAKFQITQEKLARMGGYIQAMYLLTFRLTQLLDSGSMSHEQASLVKGWITSSGRKVMSLGRELLGGNGIVTDFLVAKAFCDMEAYHSYEGTYEINALIAGRGLTGLSAIK